MVVSEQFIVNTKGKKTGVILPLEKYQQLMEDLHDLAVVAERRAEAPIVRRKGRYTSEDIHRALFPDGGPQAQKP